MDRHTRFSSAAAALAGMVLCLQTTSARTGAWTTKAPMETTLFGAGAVAMDGVVYVVGGATNIGYPTPLPAWTGAYNPVTNTWSRKARLNDAAPYPCPSCSFLPPGRGDAGVVASGGMVYVVGGGTGNGFVPNTEVYDPATDTWTDRAPIPVPTQGLTAQAVDGVVYAFGGLYGRQNNQAYDIASNTWSTKALMPTGRHGAASAVVDGVIYVVGGQKGDNSFTGAVEAYDPATNTWATLAPAPTARAYASAAVLNGIIYVFGGYIGGSVAFSTVEAYDPVANTWSTQAPLPTAREDAAAVAVNGVIYVLGGLAPSWTVYAVNEVFTPNPATSLSVAPASALYGGTTSLSATLLASGSPLAGKTVAFKLNGVTVGSAVTDSNGVATLAGVSVAGLNAGTYSNTVGAVFATDGQYTGSSGSAELVVSKAPPSISWVPAPLVYGTPLGAAQLNATASFNQVPIDGGFFYAPGPGVVLSAGNQTLTATFTPADSIDFTSPTVQTILAVTRADQVIAFGALPNKTFGDPDFLVSATASSGLPVSFAGSGSCTVAGNRVHLSGAGTCTITASQIGDGNYNTASQVVRAFSIASPVPGLPFSWGSNASGQLGVSSLQLCGGSPCSLQPLAVTSLNDAIAISASHEGHAVALKNDGTTWAWGLNNTGQLGDGTTTNRATPVQVSDLTGVTAIATGLEFSLALKSDGTVWGWGWNGLGQLGDGTSTSHSTPVRVGALTDIIAIAAGYAHSLALKNDGSAWAWGYNRYRQLGVSTAEICPVGPGLACSRSPVQVLGVSGVIAVAAGNAHTLAIGSDGTLWAWGLNDNSQLGYSTGSAYCGGDPTYYCGATPLQVPGMTGVTAAAGGAVHTLALKADGTLWAWGSNVKGQLGTSSGDNCQLGTCSRVPIQVATMSGVSGLDAGVYHSLALESDGTVWAWGQNTSGQLGDGTTVNRATPVQVTNLSDALKISAGDTFSLALSPVAPTSIAVAAAVGTYGGATTLEATLTSGGSPIAGKTVSFTLNGATAGSAITDSNGVGTLEGVSLAGIAAGTHTGAIAASFAGDGAHLPSSGSADLTVERANQSILFDALPDKSYSDPDFIVSATASSGLPVGFSADGACTIAGPTVHLTTVGLCTITASQAGDTNHNAAPPVARSFAVHDTTPPVITTPAPITVDAASPLGTTVTYTATATDAVDGSVATSCTPGSGALFPVGLTTVTCTATDTAGNAASATFTITVRTPAQMIVNLMTAVTQAGLTQAVRLLSTVRANAPLPATCGVFTAFANQVRAQSGKQLTTQEATDLIQAAAGIQGALGCR